MRSALGVCSTHKLDFATPAKGSSPALSLCYTGGGEALGVERIDIAGERYGVLDMMSRFGCWMGILLDRPAPAGASGAIVLNMLGGAQPVVGETHFINARYPNPSPAILLQVAEPKHEWIQPLREVDLEHRPLASSLHNLVIESVLRAPASERAGAGLFWEIDAFTARPMFTRFRIMTPGEPKPEQYELEYRAQMLGSVYTNLLKRLKMRHGSPTADASAIKIAHREAAYVSSMILEPMRRWFGGFEVDAKIRRDLSKAIARFACGTMLIRRHTSWATKKIFVSDGAPNSPVFAAFAAFGILAQELGVEAATWKMLTPIFVRAIGLYRCAFGRVDTPIKFVEYEGLRSDRPLRVDPKLFEVLDAPLDDTAAGLHAELCRMVTSFDNGASPNRRNLPE